MLARDDMAEAMSRFEPYLCSLAGALGLLAFERTLVANVHLDLKCEVVFVFVNIHRRSEGAGSQRFVTSIAIGLLKQPVHAVLQGGKLTEGIPTGKYGHD